MTDKENAALRKCSTESLSPKFRAGVLGATGAVGQRFIHLLRHHPWIEVVALGASEKSSGQKFKDVCNWAIPDSDLPPGLGDLVVLDAVKDERVFIDECDIIFSALSATLARGLEGSLAAAGLAVFSNAAAYRYDLNVPILIPHVNSSHLELVKTQATYKQQGGFIVTNANCSSTGLCIALKPLDDEFGIDKVIVTTLQAVSGAGFNGVSYLDIQDNVIPFIAGEEAKIEREPKKMLGKLSKKGTDETLIEDHPMVLSASTHRVPVSDGHLLSVSVKLKTLIDRKHIVASVEAAYEKYNKHFGTVQSRLPSMSKQCVRICHRDDEPQPRRHVKEGNGMTISIGRIRPCDVLDVKFSTLSHNTVIGAAGGSILNAELAIAEGILR